MAVEARERSGPTHQPHDAEIAQAILAAGRVVQKSTLREFWDEDVDGRAGRWLGETDDLIARLRRSAAGDPATLLP